MRNDENSEIIDTSSNVSLKNISQENQAHQNKIKISVIMPVYNVEKYLERSFESILNQTFTDFEVIVVNDGSTDNSFGIVQNFAQKDKRIKVINQKNQGLSMARNNGFKQVTGDYIYFFDSDDIVHPQLLEILYNTIQKENADFASCLYEPLYHKELNSQLYPFPVPYDVITDPIKFMCSGPKKFSYSVWTKLYKKSSLDRLRFNPNYRIAEDMDFNLKYFSQAKKGAYIPLKLYGYVLSDTSIMRSPLTTKKLDIYKLIYQDLKNYFKNDLNTWSLIQKRHITRNAYECIHNINMTPNKELRKHLRLYFTPILKQLFDDKTISFQGLKLKRKLKTLWFMRSLLTRIHN